jgi:DNA-binding GntR family transcriptional regulator
MTTLARTTVDLVETDDSGLIDPTGGPPLYVQLSAILRQRIEAGELTGKLPAEWELAAQFGVSSSTCKKALRLLRDSGHIRTRQGWGSWIPGPHNGPGEHP